ncbi:MAG: glutamate 5-kinase [Clostridiales bacterium]|nr:glutamate 5-kinase [Clostridiales bacterium]
MSDTRKAVREAKRIVVKVGTSTLTYDTGKVNFARIEKLAMVLSDLVNQGKEVVLVSSGAIGVGVGKLKLMAKPKTVREKQAVASVGQCELMHIYSKFFSEYGHTVGQILLTRDVVENDHTRQNVSNTFETLLKWGIIPIVNENDSVSIDEIEYGEKRVFGDNDTLSAIVAKLVNADLLIILSDIDGFYNGNPRENPEARLMPLVTGITPEIEGYAGGAGSKRGTGGMITKLTAARIAMEAGVDMVLASGSNPEIMTEIMNGCETGTLFSAKQ